VNPSVSFSPKDPVRRFLLFSELFFWKEREKGEKWSLHAPRRKGKKADDFSNLRRCVGLTVSMLKEGEGSNSGCR